MYWTVALEGGPKRVNHAAVTVGDKIYCFGGYCNGGNYEEMHNIDVYVLDTATLRWKVCEASGKEGEIPFQRYGHTVVAYKNKIYLWGGRNEIHGCNKLFCFDTKSLSWSAPLVSGLEPVARDGHSACVIGNKMYIFAGYLDYPGVYTQEVCSLNLDTHAWSFISAKEPKPIYRDFHTATALKDLMYVWGGREVASGWNEVDGDGEYGSQMYVFNPDTEEWAVSDAHGDIPVGRRSHSAVAYQDKLFIFGGFNSNENYSHYNDLHVFDPESRHWTKLSPPGVAPHPRRRQAFCLAGSKVYLFGGTSPDPNPEFAGGPDGSAADADDDDDDDQERLLVDHSDLYVLDLEPSLKVLCVAQVLKHHLDTTGLPLDLQMLIKIMTMPNKIFRPNNQSG